MLFSWLKRRRRRRLLQTPFPAKWLTYLDNDVSHYRHLSAPEQAKLRDDLRIFLSEKNWEGCGGLTLTDEMKVAISAQAMLLVLAIPHNYFERVLSILVYPKGYSAVHELMDHDGLIHDGGQGRLGEAWYRGPVVLSWDEIRYEGQHPGEGHNLVFHEFSHQLDMLDGTVDGTPPLDTPEQYRRWCDVMTAEFEQLRRASEQGRATLLDHYGATNEGEFFAVATECFFERPVPLARRHARLYDVLRDYYHQDPAKRITRSGLPAPGG